MDGVADNVVQKHTILFIDDEPRVLTSMRAMFRREYEVLLANMARRRWHCCANTRST